MQVQNNTVLACVDGSNLLPAVCDYAAWIAQRLDAPLTLLHTIDHHPETAAALDLSGNLGVDSSDQLLKDIVALELQQSKLKLRQGKLIMGAARQRVLQSGIATADLHSRHGSLVESLIALEECIGVLVVGARGKVHEDQADKIGAKLESIVRSLHKPILVVNDAFKAPERIMLAYDGSAAADKAVDMVVNSPLCRGLLCHLVCVSEHDHGGELLEKAANTLKQAPGIKLISQKLGGNPEQALCDYQNRFDIDLTVMGAFSHTRIHDLLLGSFTAKMLLQSHKPLLLLR